MHDLVKGHITFSGLVQFHFLFSLPEKLIQSKSIWSLVFSGCVFLFTYKVEKIISRNLFIRIFVLIKPDLFSFYPLLSFFTKRGEVRFGRPRVVGPINLIKKQVVGVREAHKRFIQSNSMSTKA